MKIVAALGVLLAFSCQVALADSLVVPSQGFSRNGPVVVTYRLDRPATGQGVLDVEWTDAYKRRVQHLTIPVQFSGGSEVTFSLNMRRAVAMANHLRAHLTLAPGTTGGGQKGWAGADFIARPPNPTWSDYQIIIWHERSAKQYAALKAMGVTAGKTFTNRSDEGGDMLDPERMAPLLQNDLRWYVENIAVDFYSPYHRWFPDHRAKNWLFEVAKQRYRKNPSDLAALVRNPSLSDPSWLAKIRARLTRAVQAYAPYRPLYYSLGDETGIADLAAFWDFDFSQYSLSAMRVWLRRQYGSLGALNRQWGSHFDAWNQVVPATTAEIMRRTDDNFSAWADFKAWMDVAFARALRAGTDAVHEADPNAYAAIEGAQVPGWGGYDYSLLTQAVDLIEPYDFGNNIEIVRSLNPHIVIVTTTSDGADQAYKDWRMLLDGSRGLILWDPDSTLVDAKGRPGPWGRTAAARFREFRGGLGSLLINSSWRTDPIAVLYSPASMRTQWMLDQKAHGDAWVERDAEREYEPNPLRSAISAYSRAIVHLGLQHRFLSSQQVEQGELRTGRFKVLILPHAIALSPREAAAISDFAIQGGLVIADVEPGLFDQHSRRLQKPLLSDLFRHAPEGAAFPADGRARVIYLPPYPSRPGGLNPVFVGQMRRALQKAGVKPFFALKGPEGEPVMDVAVHSFQNGDTTIIGLQRDRSSGQAAAAAPENDVERTAGGIVLTLAQPCFIYDIRRHLALGRMQRVPIHLGQVEPVILAVSVNPLPSPGIAGPDRLHPGDIADLQIRYPAAPAGLRRTVHVEVSDPTGRIVPYYTANVVVSGEIAHVTLPLALDAVEGAWTVRATDAMTGRHMALILDVARP